MRARAREPVLLHFAAATKTRTPPKQPDCSLALLAHDE